MIEFTRKLNWRNKSEGAPTTIVDKSDLLRYENGIGDLADLVNEGDLSEAALDTRYVPVSGTGSAVEGDAQTLTTATGRAIAFAVALG